MEFFHSLGNYERLVCRCLAVRFDQLIWGLQGKAIHRSMARASRDMGSQEVGFIVDRAVAI